jgi:hypothetical protein
VAESRLAEAKRVDPETESGSGARRRSRSDRDESREGEADESREGEAERKPSFWEKVKSRLSA